MVAGSKLRIVDVVDFSEPRPRWPTLCVCRLCHGYCGLYHSKHGAVHDRDLAYEVALLQHGYSTALWETPGHECENRKIVPYKCRCDCAHAWVEETSTLFMHEAACRKCKWTVRYDSSG